MLLKIVKYGDPVLARRAAMVTDFDAALGKVVADMFETMYAAPGVGLAAPQVGISKRIFVMDCTRGERKAIKVALVNPVIEAREGEQTDQEGCLSVPGYSFDITRPEHVVVSGQDPEGKPVRYSVSGIEARCVSHEVDHLDGKLLLTRLSIARRSLVENKIKKSIKRGEW
jgi:peptide deformylase